MYAQDAPLWRRYERACDYLEDDLDSGYVRVLQEMIAAGWSNPDIKRAVRQLLGGWFALLTDVARDAERRHGPLGPFTAEEAATLVGRRLHRRRSAAAARLRPRGHADPLGAASDRRGHPATRGRSVRPGRTDDARVPTDQ